MNEMNLPELPDDSIRKALKKLPPVKAAPDFEARLKRRLLEPSQEAGGAWRKFFAPGRVPAFAYSLVALVAVGYFSYYMFWRTAVTTPPAEEPSVRTTDRVAPPPPPILKQGEEAGSKDQSEAAARKTVQTKPSAQTGPEASARGETGQGAGAELDKRSAPMQVESQTRPRSAAEQRNETIRREKRAAPSQTELKTAPAPAPANNERAKVDETAREAGTESLREATQLKSAVEMQPRDVNKPAAQSPLQSRARRLAIPSAPATTYQFQSRGMVSHPLNDSAAIRDSLRLDSLKRAEKSRQDSLKRAKIK